jgi:hypothetical protein
MIGRLRALSDPEVSSQAGAGGNTVGTDASWVDAVGGCLGPHPAHGSLHVIEGSRPGWTRLRQVDEAIVDGKGDVAAVGEMARGSDDVRISARATDEPTPVDEEHRGTGPLALGWGVDVQE